MCLSITKDIYKLPKQSLHQSLAHDPIFLNGENKD